MLYFKLIQQLKQLSSLLLHFKYFILLLFISILSLSSFSFISPKIAYSWHSHEQMCTKNCELNLDWAQFRKNCDGCAFVINRIVGIAIQPTSNDSTIRSYKISVASCKTPVSPVNNDGCNGGHTRGEVIIPQSKILDTNEINALKANMTYIGSSTMTFDPMGRMSATIFRYNNFNKANFNSDDAATFEMIRTTFYPEYYSIICAMVFTSGESGGHHQDQDMIGCVAEIPMPGPPVFNEIAITNLQPYVVTPDNSDLISWFAQIDSSFESPAIKLQRYDGDAGLILKYEDIIQNPDQTQICNTFKDDIVNYCAALTIGDPSSICVYNGNYSTTDNQSNSDNLIGCVPRPSMSDRSNYSMMADYTTICDYPSYNTKNSNLNSNLSNSDNSSILNTSSASNNAETKLQNTIYDTKKYTCIDPEMKPYQAVVPMIINTKPNDNIIGKDMDGDSIAINENYALHKVTKSSSLSSSSSSNTKDQFIPANGSLLELYQAGLLSEGLIVQKLGLYTQTVYSNTDINADSNQSNGLREYFIYNAPSLNSNNEQVSQSNATNNINQILTDSGWIKEINSKISSIIINQFNTNDANNVSSKSIIVATNENDTTMNLNCRTYKETNSGAAYFIPAYAKKRDRQYCYCDGFDKCVEGTDKSVCDVALCKSVDNVNINVSYAICPGVYNGIDTQDINTINNQNNENINDNTSNSNSGNRNNSNNSNKNGNSTNDKNTEQNTTSDSIKNSPSIDDVVKNILPIIDQICFYSIDGWDFISGNKDPTILNKPICTVLKPTCDPVITGAEWNGHATWYGNRNVNNNQNNIDTNVKYIKDSQVEDSQNAITNTNNKANSYDAQNGYNVFGDNDIQGICEDGYEAQQNYNTALKDPTSCVEFNAIKDDTVKQNLVKNFPIVLSQWATLIENAQNNEKNIDSKDISQNAELAQYNIALPSCAGLNSNNTSPNQPIADCIGGIYGNFRNKCYKKSDLSSDSGANSTLN